MSSFYNSSLHSDFVCMHCHNFVSAGYVVAGVNNRNHCPYCLWSRHLDWRQAGDRLSACKSGMQPIGLTVKRKRKKYGLHAQGELMLVHQCIECEKITINRIAADDDSQTAFEIYQQSLSLDRHTRQVLDENGIQVLDRRERQVVEAQLFGQSRVFA